MKKCLGKTDWQTLWSSRSRLTAEQSHWNEGLFSGCSSQQLDIMEYLQWEWHLRFSYKFFISRQFYCIL